MERMEEMGLMELTPDEANELAGGYLHLAAFALGAFGSGFRFGYYELGPRIFG